MRPPFLSGAGRVGGVTGSIARGTGRGGGVEGGEDESTSRQRL